MKMKSLLIATLAAVGIVGFTQANANNLTINNNSVYPTINVTCNGKPGVPIGKTVTLGYPFLVNNVFHTNVLNCEFKAGATVLGTAAFEITAPKYDTATVKSASAIIKYSVVPGIGTPYPDLTVNLG